MRLARLGFCALSLAALGATIFRRDVPSVSPRPDPRFFRLNDLNNARYQAVVRWSALAARDSAVAQLAAPPAVRARIELRYLGFPRGLTSPAAEALLRDFEVRLGARDSAVRVLVALYNSTPYDSLHVWGGQYAGALIVPARQGTACAAVVPAELGKRGQISLSRRLLERAISPCLLLGAFGPPGAGIQPWLAATRYAAAQSAAWITRPASYLDGNGDFPWAWGYELGWPGVSFDGNSLSGSLGLTEVIGLLAPPYQIGAAGVRCLVGDQSSCRSAVKAPLPTIDGIPPDLTFHRGVIENRRSSILEPHPLGYWYLSDLIRDQGRERFARFWQSDRPMEEAFRQVYGEDIGSWTERWGTRQWKGTWIAKVEGRQVILGASLSPSWPLLAIAWSGAFFLIAAATARRRQVT